jgi:hypothetical protein
MSKSSTDLSSTDQIKKEHKEFNKWNEEQGIKKGKTMNIKFKENVNK